MDETWERAVEAALEGQADPVSVRILTLDGAVKCLHGRLPPPSVLEKFQNLQHLSIANIGVSSLEQFPRLRNLQKLMLSDNRIAGGLEFLVEAGLDSLRDLDLSNNRIQYIEDLAPLAQLKLVSLDLYECPVTRIKDYRSRVFGLIKSLKYLDKMDAEENERPESDEEDEDDDEDEGDDPGSGEVDGDEQPYVMNNRHGEGGEGIVDVDEDEESDADEEEMESGRIRINGLSNQVNGFQRGAMGQGEIGDGDEEDGGDEDEDDSGEEVDDDDVVEVHEIDDSDDEEDNVEDDDEDDDDDEEEVDNEEGGFHEPQHNGRLFGSMEGEIDGHEHGEDEEEYDDGETGEEEQGVEENVEFEENEDGEEEEEDYGAGYLVQPVSQVMQDDAGTSDMDPGNEDDEHEEGGGGGGEGEEEVDDEEEVQELPPSPSYLKRKRDDEEEVQELPPSPSYLKRKRDDLGEGDNQGDEDPMKFVKSSKKNH